MSTAKIAISLNAKTLQQIDQLVAQGLFPNRSKLIQAAVVEKIDRLQHLRLARECAKLVPEEEQAAAVEVFGGEVEWPEY